MSEYIICDLCKGTGIDEAPPGTSPPRLRWDHCKKCKGVGKLSWVENIFGKPRLKAGDYYIKQNNTTKYLKKKRII